MYQKINSKRKVITIFTSLTYPINSGAGRNAYNFALALSEYKYNVKLISLNNANNKAEKKEVNNYFSIYQLPIRTHNKFLKRIQALKAIRYYNEYLKTTDINIIYGQLPGYMYIILYSYFNGKKSIFRSTMLGEDDIEYIINKYGKIIGKFRKYVFNKLSFYFAINKEFSNKYLNQFPNKNNIIETTQGIDNKIFYKPSTLEKKNLRAKYNLPDAKPILLSVGYLIKRKGFEEIFNALSQCTEDFLYIIIGDNDVESSNYLRKIDNTLKKEIIYLREYGKKLLGKKLILTGPVLDDINEYYKIADVFILNSYREGTPNVLMEAMACGNIVLVKKLEGLNDFLTFHKKNCLIHESENELKVNLKNILSNINFARNLADNASAFIREKHTFNAVIEKHFYPILNK